jgi:peptidyl-prolyl cis-trans isomerase B (cyclophilin B)
MSNQKNPVAEIKMKNGGVMKVELYAWKAPISVANFIDLAMDGFYDGLLFHRVVRDFIIQAGAKSGSCAGEELGFTIKGEFRANGVDTGLTHKRGAISMARTSVPDSASSQFFLCHDDAGNLDGQYAMFGMITEGFEVLDAIAETPTKPSYEENRPLEPQVIESVKIVLNDYKPTAPVRIGEILPEYRKNK